MKNKLIFGYFLIPFFSLFVFLLVGELAVRLYLINHTVYDVEMAKYAMILKTDTRNPLIGHVHKANTIAQLMDVEVRINSDGLRDKEYSERKGEKYRIVFLGDSITFGWGVEREDTFESILEESINKRYPAEIINFGTGNYNTEQEVNLFIEKGLKYKPDKVVLFYSINDAELTPKKSNLWFLGHSRIITFYWSRFSAFINSVYSKNFKVYYSALYGKDQKGWKNSQKALGILKDVCSKNDMELQVVLLPELHELRKYPFKKENNAVASFLKTNDIEHIDLTMFFEGYRNPENLWVSPDDPHPNKIAHKLIAEYSLDFISKTGDKR